MDQDGCGKAIARMQTAVELAKRMCEWLDSRTNN